MGPPLCVVCQADRVGDDGVGGHGAAKTLLGGNHTKGAQKSASTAATAPAAPTHWGEGGDNGDDEACCGSPEVEGLGGIITGQSSSGENTNEGSDGTSGKTNKILNPSSAPDAAASVAGTGGGRGGSGDSGDQGYMGSLSPGVDDGWGSWDGAGRRTPPRTSRSPASSPGLTPLRGRSRRGWWRRRRDKYPTGN